VVPDVLEQCIVEGECQQLSVDRIGPRLHEVVRDGGNALRNEVTVFDSTGWAVEDDTALRLAVELADRHGLGIELALEYLPIDPFDPYAAASDT
jgi:ornithine cyclodeaminase/alanine dehydrogenase-like protein (mu-crystallin family)